MSICSRALLDVLGRYTAFPWAFVVITCKRLDLEPARLQPLDLVLLVQPLAMGLATLSDVDEAFALKRDLTLLAGGVWGDAA